MIYKKNGMMLVTILLFSLILILFTILFLIYFLNDFTTISVETELQDGHSSYGTKILALDNSILYLKNKDKNFIIKEIKINDKVCVYNYSQNNNLTVKKVDISNCLNNVKDNTTEILILTNKDLIHKKIYFDRD